MKIIKNTLKSELNIRTERDSIIEYTKMKNASHKFAWNMGCIFFFA